MPEKYKESKPKSRGSSKDQGSKSSKLSKKSKSSRSSKSSKSKSKSKKSASNLRQRTPDEDSASFDLNLDGVDHFDPEYNEEDLERDYQGRVDNESDEERGQPSPQKISKKSKERLKAKIIDWLNEDDAIASLNKKLKKHKDNKKQKESIVIKLITQMKMEDSKIDVHDGNELRGRVYRHKHVTKGPLKEEIIKDALMEAIRDEKKVNQLIKKIDSKRPINERFYLKRTKGNGDQ